MLRSIIMVGCETELAQTESPQAADWRKRGGAGGCIATAGASVTTSRRARTRPDNRGNETQRGGGDIEIGASA